MSPEGLGTSKIVGPCFPLRSVGVPLYLTGGTGSRVLGRDELVGVKDSSVTEMGWGGRREGRKYYSGARDLPSMPTRLANRWYVISEKPFSGGETEA